MLFDRYNQIFLRVHGAEKALAIRHHSWGLALGLIGSAAYYGAYAWIAISAIGGRITLGQMTMYLTLFQSGQGAVGSLLGTINRIYEDQLYLSTLYEFLDTPTKVRNGSAVRRGPRPTDGIRFEGVSFTYPGTQHRALQDVTFHVRPGESLALVGENGSGKTTLIKLLTRLYTPTSGLDALGRRHRHPRRADSRDRRRCRSRDLRSLPRALMQQRIAILISHRFSTVRMADQIIVIGQGRMVERGSHAELMALGGRYAHLFNLQARGYQ